MFLSFSLCLSPYLTHTRCLTLSVSLSLLIPPCFILSLSLIHTFIVSSVYTSNLFCNFSCSVINSCIISCYLFFFFLFLFFVCPSHFLSLSLSSIFNLNLIHYPNFLINLPPYLPIPTPIQCWIELPDQTNTICPIQTTRSHHYTIVTVWM